MLSIKILGAGCPNCKKLEAVARQAVDMTGVEAEIVKVTEIPGIMAYDILSTPGLVVNEKVVSSGQIPSIAEVSIWLADAEIAAAN